MRVFLSLFLSYLLLCFVGTTLLASLVTAFIGCLSFVVGHPINLVSVETFLFSLKAVFPIVIIFSQMFLILSTIRNSNKQHLSGIISIFILTIVSWVVVLPGFYKVTNSIPLNPLKFESKTSEGVFRIDGDKLYYFTKVNSDNSVDGVEIKLNQNDENNFAMIDNKNVKMAESGEYSDVLVKQVLLFPEFLKKIVKNVFGLCNVSKMAFSNSIISWFLFCLFGLALYSVIFISRVSNWRLINAFFVLIGTLAIFKINCILCGIGVSKSIFEYVNLINQKIISSWNGFAQFYSPICVLCNVLIIVILIIIGIFCKPKKISVARED